MPRRATFRSGSGALLVMLGVLLGHRISVADDDADAARAPIPASGPTRYGLFDLLDHRSIYGKDWFPEPFRVEDTDVGNQFRFDWEHDEGKGFVRDIVNAQVQKSFGLFT